MHHESTGVVLAGGTSRRMGRDKRAIVLDERPLLVAAADALAAVCDEVLVVTADATSPVAVAGARVIGDRRAGAGPLAGIEAGLAEAAHDPVLVLAGDHPAAAAAVLADLLGRLAGRDDLDAVVLGTAHGPQPLVGAYRRSIRPVVSGLLESGRLAAGGLLEELAVEVVGVGDWSRLDPGRETAVDLDTPADVAAWQASR